MIYGQRIRKDDGSLVRRKVRTSPWKTSSGFRLIRVFTHEHNASRFRHHVDALERQFDRDRANKKFKLFIRRRRRAEAALKVRQ